MAAEDPNPVGGPRPGGLSYRRQQTLSLLVLAAVPLILFGALALRQVSSVIVAEADSRAVAAARSVSGLLDRDVSDLQALVSSYAGWNVVQADAAADAEEDLHSVVIDFQVARGSVDAAALNIGPRWVLAGAPEITGGLQSVLTAALRQGEAQPGPGYVMLSDGLYLVAVSRIDVGGLTGKGVTLAGSSPIGIAFARRIDSRFLLESKRLTNVDIALYDDAGSLLAASDDALAGRAGRPDLAGLQAGPSDARHPQTDLVAVADPLVDRSGRVVGAAVVMAEIAAIATVGSDVVLLLAGSVGIALVLALALAYLLARRLGNRLATVSSGLAAVARGDLGVRLPAGERDDLERLASSHNRLAGALEHRDRVVWQSVDAIDSLTPGEGPRVVAAEVASAARSIFGLRGCRVVDADGTPVAADPLGAAEGPPRGQPTERAALWAGDRAALLEGWSPEVAQWSTADRGLLRLFARNAGVVLRNAGLFAEETERADRLVRINELQRDFLRGVSHNLQTPITKILVVSDDLADSAHDDVARRARGIHTNASRLARMVEQLLTLSRLDAGAYTPEADVFAVAPLARRAWDAQGTERPLELVDRATDALAVGDRAAVEQVLWVLFDNALLYAPSGAVHVEVAVRDAAAAVLPREGRSADSEGGEAGHEIVVRVRDEGPGVPVEERALIFERFQRGSNASARDGTGLGLDVARGLMRSMGGAIWYEEAPGGGAVFAFSLPAELAGDAGEPPDDAGAAVGPAA